MMLCMTRDPLLISTSLETASCHLSRRTGAGWDPWPWSSQGSRFVVSLSGYIRFPWTGTYRFEMQGVKLTTRGVRHISAMDALCCAWHAKCCQATYPHCASKHFSTFTSTWREAHIISASYKVSAMSAVISGLLQHANLHILPHDLSASTCSSPAVLFTCAART